MSICVTGVVLLHAPGPQVHAHFVGADARCVASSSVPHVDERQVVLTLEARVQRVDLDAVEENAHAAESPVSAAISGAEIQPARNDVTPGNRGRQFA